MMILYCKRVSRLAAQKHICGLLNSRWADTHLIFLYCTNTWHHTTIYLQAAGQHKNKAGLTHSPVYYYPFASTHMVNTQLLCVLNVHTNYHKYFRWFFNSCLLNFARNSWKLMCRQYFHFYSSLKAPNCIIIIRPPPQSEPSPLALCGEVLRLDFSRVQDNRRADGALILHRCIFGVTLHT